MSRARPADVNEYISGFPPGTQKALKLIRAAIRRSAPKADEAISYSIPAYRLDGQVLIYFAGFANHVSVYPAPRSTPEFRAELAGYKGGKGTVQFPLDAPIPIDLIERIVKFRITQL